MRAIVTGVTCAGKSEYLKTLLGDEVGERAIWAIDIRRGTRPSADSYVHYSLSYAWRWVHRRNPDADVTLFFEKDPALAALNSVDPPEVILVTADADTIRERAANRTVQDQLRPDLGDDFDGALWAAQLTDDHIAEIEGAWIEFLAGLDITPTILDATDRRYRVLSRPLVA